MVLDIIFAGIIAVAAGIAGYTASSTVLAYASEGPTPRVFDKFVNLCMTFALVAVFVVANLAAGGLYDHENETVTVIADVLGLVATPAMLVFYLCAFNLVTTYKDHRLKAIFDPDTPAIEPTTWLRAVLHVSAVVTFSAIVLAVLL